jgi:uncharacterized protein (DUF302 family)
MGYYISVGLKLPFDDAIASAEAALKTEGFGVISRIDIRQTLKAKIDVDFRPYTILGACNPTLAHEALQLEDKVGLMLPCNVIVQQSASDEVEVAAIDPVASMQAISNPALLEAAEVVREKLASAIDRLRHSQTEVSEDQQRRNGMSAIEKLKTELAELRDEAKVQAHLGSMELRQEWKDAEAKWNHFVAEARLHESGDNIRSALEILGEELRATYERLKKSL